MHISKNMSHSQERMVVATVQNFIWAGAINGKMSIKLKDIIDATTGDYLLHTAYVQINDEIRQMELEQYDKFFFFGKPVKRRHGKIFFDKIHNVLSQKDSELAEEFLEKMKYRRQYIMDKKEINEAEKNVLKTRISDIENSKLKFKGNDLIYIRPIHTIETRFSNRFHNFPLLYTAIDTFKKWHNSDDSFLDIIKDFSKTYKNIRQVHLCKEDIKCINEAIIDSYKKMRQINKRSINIEKLLSTVESCYNRLENNVILSKNIVWEQVNDSTLENSLEKVKTKSL